MMVKKIILRVYAKSETIVVEISETKHVSTACVVLLPVPPN